MSSSGFDLAAHQRERIRRLERDLAGVTGHRDRLERLLALALQVAAGDECEPLALLRALELLLDADAGAGRSGAQRGRDARAAAPHRSRSATSGGGARCCLSRSPRLRGSTIAALSRRRRSRGQTPGTRSG
jgi:hypothetical protein